VTSGELTYGFFAHAPAGFELGIDGVSLVMLDQDPAAPAYGSGETLAARLSVTKAGGALTAAYTARDISNAARPAILVAAEYDAGGRLVRAASRNVGLGAGGVSRGQLAFGGQYDPAHAYRAFLWDARTFAPLCDAAEFAVLGVRDVVLDVDVGQGIRLPGTVRVWYKEDASAQEDVPVAWDAFDPALAARVGAFTVEGAVEGTALRAVARVATHGVNLVRNPDLESAEGWALTAPMARASSAYNTHGPNPGYINYSQSGAGTLTGVASQTFESPLPGTYRLHCWVEGVTNVSDGMVELYVKINGEEHASVPITVTAWAEWWNPAIDGIPVPAGATVEIGVRASHNNGSWYHFDDFVFIQTD